MPAEIPRWRLGHCAGMLLRRGREKRRPYDVYLGALLIFAASRTVVIIGVDYGTLLVRIANPKYWDAGPAWYYRLLRWDSGWYASIARDGYRYHPDSSVESSTVFYPLYPLVSSAVASLFGIDVYMALLLVANVAALVAVLLMTKFVKDALGDEVALLSLACFCFFPFSLFLSAGYAESLSLMLVLPSLIFLTRQKFVSAAALAGLALAARPTAIVLAPVILWEMWRRNTLPWRRLLPRMALCGGLAGSGLLAYTAYLGIAFGHPLAFITAQAAWHHETLADRVRPTVALVTLQYQPSPWQIDSVFLTFEFLSSLGLMIWSFRRLGPALSLYGLGALLLPSITLGIYASTNRFVLMCVPAFMGLGLLCKGRPWLASVIIGIFAALLFVNSELFSQWYLVG